MHCPTPIIRIRLARVDIKEASFTPQQRGSLSLRASTTMTTILRKKKDNNSNNNNNNNSSTEQQQQQHGICPFIINKTKYSIVVFQERGVLYNQQVLAPNEAVGISRLATAGLVLPYRVHAVIGDHRSLPTRAQSAKTLLRAAAIPTAFCAATLMSAGALSGPSTALAPLVTGLVIGKAVVIDAAAVAAGAVAANRAAVVADMIVKKHPDKFMCRSKAYRPGKRYLCVTGGIDSDLGVEEMKESEYKALLNGSDDQKRGVSNGTASSKPGIVIKAPTNTIKDKIEFYTPGLGGKRKGDDEMEGMDETILQQGGKNK